MNANDSVTSMRTRRRVRVTGVAVLAAGGLAAGGVWTAGAAFAADVPSHPASSPAAGTSRTRPTPPAPGSVVGHGAATGAAAPAPPVAQPSLSGTVTSTSRTTVSIRDPEGFTRTIDLLGSTEYFRGTTRVTRSAIHRGTIVLAVGSVASDGTSLDASRVSVGVPAGPVLPAGPTGGPGALPGPAAGPTRSGAPKTAPAPPKPMSGSHSAPAPGSTSSSGSSGS